MLKVIIFTAIFVGLLCLYVYFRQVVVMRSQGGMSRKYKVLVDFILGLDKKYEIWEEADFSMKIGYSNANHKLSVQGFSGGVKLESPFLKSFSSMVLWLSTITLVRLKEKKKARS